MLKRWILVASWLAWCLVLWACDRQTPVQRERASTVSAASGDAGGDFGAMSADAIPPRVQIDIRRTTAWPPAKIVSGSAWVSCETDHATHGDGEALVNLQYFSVLDAMLACQPRDVVRLRYKGKIAADFTSLVERVANMATRMGIDERILDIDSSGGQVEEAIRAGDAIAESNWTIRLRDGAICHSACVLILAAGDDRLISGKVGIHRIIRLVSRATSRAELNHELRDVHTQMKQYLERNGAGVAVADLMMTVPNRSLRLLTDAELEEYGLQGANAAEDDLERIKLARKCGPEFVRRKDAFARAFDGQCTQPDQGVDAVNACGLALRDRFGFPDRKCPADSPMAGYDRESGATRG